MMRNPLSIEAFADWCDKQPKVRLLNIGATYSYSDTDRCAFCKYLKSLGFPKPFVVPGAWIPDKNNLNFNFNEDWHFMPPGMEAALHARPHTYEALAVRLRAIQ